MSKSYITLLNNDDYLIGVLGLNESLKQVQSTYPLTVAITKDVSLKSKQILNNNHIKTVEIEKMKIPDLIKAKNLKGEFSHWNNTFDKLKIFELIQFDKLVFLDSDMYIRKNVDNLFERKNLSAVIDRREPYINEGWKKLTSGLMVIKPQLGYIEKFTDIIKDIALKKNAIGDQDVLQEYDKNWQEKEELHLDVIYNTFFIYLDYYIKVNNYQMEDIAVIHFILNRKPWSFKKGNIKEYLKLLENRLQYNYERTNKNVYKQCLSLGHENKMEILEEYINILDNLKEKNNLNI